MKSKVEIKDECQCPHCIELRKQQERYELYHRERHSKHSNQGNQYS